MDVDVPPTIALVPPIPFDHCLDPVSSSSARTSPASSPSTGTTSYYSTTTSSDTEDRESSETTIFSIYSMYGSDSDGGARPQSQYIKGDASRDNVAYEGNGSGRPDSADAPLVQHPFDAGIVSDDVNMSVANGHATQKRESLHVPPLQASAFRYRVPEERRSSAHNSLQHPTPVPALPVDIPARSIAPALQETCASAAVPQVLRTPSPSTSTSSASPPYLTPPTTTSPSKLPLKHPVYVDSPSSRTATSLVPSEGEDMDGFHVRNTYAQLEILGVKGDGYEEGVERTRARVGSSRASQYAAEAAIADSAEKKRDLDAYEVDLLNNLDRYGFYSVTSHDRLALLPTASLPAITLTSSLKSPNPSTAPPAVKALPPPTRSIKEDSRIEKWQRMLVPQQHGFPQWVFRPSLQDSKLRRRIYKGIPDRWRSVAWMVLLERMVMKDKRVNIHDECVRLERVYREELEKASPFDIQIDLDVPRTISGHVMFKTRYGQGQRSLFHVLHSFSLHCLDCGYVQGMGPITATFLCYVPPVVAYRALVFLHTSPSYNIHSLFSPGFPGLLECIYLQEKLTQLAMPDVYNAFKKNMITSMSYATKWYITLFANTVPFQTMLRIWDAFLLEGVDVFCVVATAILWAYREYIASPNASFETILSLLSSFFVPENEDAFMHWIERTLGNRKIRTLFGEWRREWRTMVSEKREGNALL